MAKTRVTEKVLDGTALGAAATKSKAVHIGERKHVTVMARTGAIAATIRVLLAPDTNSAGRNVEPEDDDWCALQLADGSTDLELTVPSNGGVAFNIGHVAASWICLEATGAGATPTAHVSLIL